MARRKREPMSEGKKNIIAKLIEEYDIRTAKDIEDALRDLMGGTIQEMLEAELDEHLGYRSYERSDSSNYRNGKKTKKIRGNLGETEIEVPQDRDGTFEPKVVKKRQKDISGIEQKIISLYAKGMTTRQISDTIEEIYGFEVSDGMVSDITDRLLPQIEDWQNRPLDEVYPIVFIDAVHFSVRDNGQIRNLAAYVILAVSLTGHKEVLSIHIGENKSAKYWLGVLNELKNRGVKDVLVICADGLSGMKEAVNTAFPQTELQRCIVHQVRNTLKYVGAKNKKEFANDLKTIYHAPSEDAALKQLEHVTEKWEKDYPNAMKSWYKNWDVISPIFKFSADVRKVIYTTSTMWKETTKPSFQKISSYEYRTNWYAGEWSKPVPMAKSAPTAATTALHRLSFAANAVKCSAEFTGTIAAANPSSGAALAGWNLPVRNAMQEPSMKRY